VEVHRPGVGSLPDGVLTAECPTPARLRLRPAIEVLKPVHPDASLDRVLLFLPDALHKKKHISAASSIGLFAEQLRSKAERFGGVFHHATRLGKPMLSICSRS